jgi:hypothetical protein
MARCTCALCIEPGKGPLDRSFGQQLTAEVRCRSQHVALGPIAMAGQVTELGQHPAIEPSEQSSCLRIACGCNACRIVSHCRRIAGQSFTAARTSAKCLPAAPATLDAGAHRCAEFLCRPAILGVTCLAQASDHGSRTASLHLASPDAAGHRSRPLVLRSSPAIESTRNGISSLTIAIRRQRFSPMLEVDLTSDCPLLALRMAASRKSAASSSAAVSSGRSPAAARLRVEGEGRLVSATVGRSWRQFSRPYKGLPASCISGSRLCNYIMPDCCIYRLRDTPLPLCDARDDCLWFEP